MSAEPALTIIILNRSAFRPTAESVAELQKAGLGGWIDRQLAPDDPPDTDVHVRLPSVRLLVSQFQSYSPSDIRVSSVTYTTEW
jgi:hypothetical protein